MSRRIDVPDAPRRAIYIGNLSFYQVVQGPGAQLEFFDWGIRLQTRTAFGRIDDRYEIRYDELTSADQVGKLVRRGIRFHTDVLPEQLIFVTVDGRAILDLLEQRGVPVNHAVKSWTIATLKPGSRHRGPAIAFLGIVGPLLVLLVIFEILPEVIGAQENFRTLHSDLAQIHLPAGYQLTGGRRVGTSCAQATCSLKETWTWASPGRRSAAQQCADAKRALNSAYPGADANSPLPASSACDYYVVLGSFWHPSQGQRTVDAIVQTGTSRPGEAVAVRLVATYS